MLRAVYVITGIIILALAGVFPAYLVLGQGGDQVATVTVTAQPAYSPPRGGGGAPAAECPAGEVATTGRATSAGLVTQGFVIRSFDKRFSLFIDEGIVVLTPNGKCPRCLGIHKMEQPPSLPERAHLIGVMYDAVPDKTTFTPPAALIYSYDPNGIPEGIAEASLVIAGCDTSGEWLKLDSVVDTEAHTITAKIGLFKDLAVLGYEVEAAPIPTPTPTPTITPTPTPVEPTPTEPTPAEPTPAKPLNWWLIGGIIAAVVIAGFVIFLVRRMSY